ncbi:thymidylate kinase [Paenarthrobacter sp. NPDC092416]|uniref:thymidylate kinase n=1 Tax=Paenarthrobacter sp. NPDC092416 TaxID=3364386 RepID=UPI00382EC4A4
MLIVLTGIDGSGKTTAARALVDSARTESRNALLLSNHAARRRLSLIGARIGWKPPARLADFIETGVRVVNVLISHARASRFDGLVVMDRHLHCQLALREAAGLPRGRFLPWLLKALPSPDLMIHFDVDPQRACRRVMARGTDSETLADLIAFRDAYRSLPEFDQFLEVDANGDPEATLSHIRLALAQPSLTSQPL